MNRARSARRPSPSPCDCGPQARGTCPHATACPRCHAAPGSPCKRPSGHPAGAMHAERYRVAERADAAACSGFEPLETPAGTGCLQCSGLPEDHPSHPSGSVTSAPGRPPRAVAPGERSGASQGTLF